MYWILVSGGWGVEMGKWGNGGGGWTYRNTQLIKNLTEPIYLPFHFLSTLLPETVLLRFAETYGDGFLEGGYAAETYPRVGCGDVADEVGGADQEADAPARGVEVFAGGTDG